MKKTLVIAAREFRQRVRTRGFIISSIAVPLIMLLVWAFTGGMDGSPGGGPPTDPGQPDRPDGVFGYVDRAGLVQTIPEAVPDDLFRPFPDQGAAEAALDRAEITAYYLIPADYRDSGAVQRISPSLAVNPPDVTWFNRLLAANLLSEADPKLVERVRRPFGQTGLNVQTLTAGDQTPIEPGNTMLPFLVTIAIIIPLFTSGGYLFQSLTQEKGNRIMEILLISLRPGQLFGGKLLGLSGLTLVQYLIWVGLGGLALLATGQNPARLLAGLNLSAGELGLIVPFALAGFLLYAALMAGIGALARDVEDSRSWLFIISLPMMIPIYLWAAIVASPNGSLAVILSLIPFSAPVAMLLRLTSAAVPPWQVATSLALLLLTGLGTVWLMARLFRVQTLLSGESFSLGRMWAALRG